MKEISDSVMSVRLKMAAGLTPEQIIRIVDQQEVKLKALKDKINKLRNILNEQ